MKTFSQILNDIRRDALSEQEKGARFERLMQAFLKTYPLYASIFEEVWLWNEFPYRRKLGGHDLGIDLVCKTLGGAYWAVQCKCYAEDSIISKEAVDSFLSTSSRTFLDSDGKQIGFSQRLWISTTNNWNINAEETLKHQTPPLVRLNLSELEAAEVDWEKLADGLFGADYQSPRFTLRDHQKKALKNAHAYYQDHDRGKLIMACGTGKTFTALRIVEQETQSKGLVLYLVPSIALLGQTLRSWFDQAQKPIAAVCVCSDSGVSQGVRGKRKRNDEEYDRKDNVVDLAYPATTFTPVIVSHLKAIRAKKKTGLTVVFSTYQSLDAVQRAQQQLLQDSKGEWGVFDFVVCDEAHRTTGVTLKGEDESQFVKIHDNTFIQARKRMYMTATPRIYTEGAIQRARIVSATLCSMDDEKLYGEEFYRIGFGEAVEKQLLTDYKVLVITLCKDDISPELARIISEKDISENDAAQFAGCIAAISKRVIGDEGILRDVDPQPMRRAVSFCNSIRNSQLITRVFNECRQAYEGNQELMMVDSHHVDGTMSAPRRDKELQWLKEMPANSNECRMLTNAKCLSEGVDVPSLDAVLFLSSRDSQVDVVQSVGRVMRTAEGKKYGYIIIPVVVPEEEDANQALDGNEAYKVVWTVLNALRAHDDRFNAEINKIDLGSHSKRIIITHPPKPDKKDPSDVIDGPDVGQTADANTVKAALVHFGEFQKAFYGKLVVKCGSRHYLEDWAKDVAEMSERRIRRIREVIVSDAEKKDFFNDLLNQMRQNINPTLSEDSFIEMLGQHFVSAPVFESLFGNQQFVESNPVSQVLQAAVELLAEDDMTDDEKDKLAAMRKDVQLRVEGVTDAAGRQRIIKELYEKFFAVAAHHATEQLGIVYTPIPVVDFIVHSVGYIVQKEFGRSLSDENVHILDPFTGTGTFISRLLQSGLIRKEDLPRKYKQEIHANEIVLLAYYIASINIETVYHSLLHNEEKDQGDYKDFQGICLTDTFQLGEAGSAGNLFAKDFEINSQRLIEQRKTPLTVIMGNPPYSVGQRNANDNAQNTHYPLLEAKIAATYVAGTNATMKGALYDSYIKAFRWATDRLGKEEGGVIGFVTNGGWIDGNAMDGMRRCFETDFSAIYVFNLRGNQRTSGELSRKEGGKVFGSGSRAPIAITILVKKPHADGMQKARIYYHDIGDYLTTQQKFDIINQFHDISRIPWTTIHPDQYGDWINLRNERFATYTILGDKKKDNKAHSFFLPHYSRGVATGRDAWVYNSSLKVVQQRAKEQIDYYNQTLDELSNGQRQELDFKTNKISWTRAVQNDILKRKKRYYIADATYREVMYRPFCKQQLLYYAPLNEMQYQIPSIFPTPQHKNLVICVPGIGVKKDFSCLIIDVTPDLELIGKSQCFPLYYYDQGPQEGDTLFSKAEGRDAQGYVQRSCLTDEIYVQAKHLYGKQVTREDIFYYIYGLLHSPQYRQQFADDLKKSLPRLPLLEDKELFYAFSQAGRELADLHLHYEQVEPYRGCTILFGGYGLEGNVETDYRVKKMTFGKTKDNQKDKSVIIFNNGIRIENIPLEAYDYVVNGQSAIEWIMERYAYTIDTKTGFVNDPNDWGLEHNDPKYIYNLLLRMINVSLQTQEIVASLPAFTLNDCK